MKKKFVLPRHRFLKTIIGPVLDIIHKCNKVNVVKDKTIKGPCLVLSNHQTSNDQFFVDRIFKPFVNFVATEDIFSLGFTSKCIRYLSAPVMKIKSIPDISTIRNCSNIMKENGIVGIFPEGNRTYSSKQCNIDISIAKMVKMFNVDVYLVNITNGYGYQPRWGDKVRKCPVDVRIVDKISKEDVEKLDLETLHNKICKALDVSNKETNTYVDQNKDRALYMERLFFVCPKCGSISSLHSLNNSISCDKCDFEATYNKDLTFSSNLELLNNKKIDTWYYEQEKWIKEKPLEYFDRFLFKDDCVTMKQTIIGKRKVLIGHGPLKMNNEFLEITTEHHTYTIKLNDIISISVLGKHKFNVYLPGNTIYQFIGDTTFNAIKYMYLYYHIRNIKGGNKNDEFLGI